MAVTLDIKQALNSVEAILKTSVSLFFRDLSIKEAVPIIKLEVRACFLQRVYYIYENTKVVKALLKVN